MNSVRRSLSSSNVISAAALFVALGGSAYAAVNLPRDSVGKAQIRMGAVGKSEIRSRGVGTAEIRGGAVGRSELARDSVGRSELRPGAVAEKNLAPALQRRLSERAAPGPAGPAGPAGATGPAGPAGPGAQRLRYTAAATATPQQTTLFDIGGVEGVASCEQDGAVTNVLAGVRSSEDATMQETVFLDSGSDPRNVDPATNPTTVFNEQIDLTAGVLATGPIGASTGFARVAADAVVSNDRRTLHFKVVAIADADNDRCTIDGIALPAT